MKRKFESCTRWFVDCDLNEKNILDILYVPVGVGVLHFLPKLAVRGRMTRLSYRSVSSSGNSSSSRLRSLSL